MQSPDNEPGIGLAIYMLIFWGAVLWWVVRTVKQGKSVPVPIVFWPLAVLFDRMSFAAAWLRFNRVRDFIETAERCPRKGELPPPREGQPNSER